MKIVALFATVVVAALPQSAYAQSPQPATEPAAAPAAAQPCAACHGARGEGIPAAGFPRIAAQSQYYIARQLRSYADGSRRNPVMEGFAKTLSAADRASVGTYYAQLDAPAAASGDVAPPERGRVLAIQGSAERRVQACINCHGPGGSGEPPAYPYLAGLDAKYIAAALQAWKDGTRTNDTGQQMLGIARALTPEDVAAVADYFASLPPPKPSPLDIVQAPAAR